MFCDQTCFNFLCGSLFSYHAGPMDSRLSKELLKSTASTASAPLPPDVSHPPHQAILAPTQAELAPNPYSQTSLVSTDVQSESSRYQTYGYHQPIYRNDFIHEDTREYTERERGSYDISRQSLAADSSTGQGSIPSWSVSREYEPSAFLPKPPVRGHTSAPVPVRGTSATVVGPALWRPTAPVPGLPGSETVPSTSDPIPFSAGDFGSASHLGSRSEESYTKQYERPRGTETRQSTPWLSIQDVPSAFVSQSNSISSKSVLPGSGPDPAARGPGTLSYPVGPVGTHTFSGRSIKSASTAREVDYNLCPQRGWDLANTPLISHMNTAVSHVSTRGTETLYYENQPHIQVPTPLQPYSFQSEPSSQTKQANFKDAAESTEQEPKVIQDTVSTPDMASLYRHMLTRDQRMPQQLPGIQSDLGMSSGPPAPDMNYAYDQGSNQRVIHQAAASQAQYSGMPVFPPTVNMASLYCQNPLSMYPNLWPGSGMEYPLTGILNPAMPAMLPSIAELVAFWQQNYPKLFASAQPHPNGNNIATSGSLQEDQSKSNLPLSEPTERQPCNTSEEVPLRSAKSKGLSPIETVSLSSEVSAVTTSDEALESVGSVSVHPTQALSSHQPAVDVAVQEALKPAYECPEVVHNEYSQELSKHGLYSTVGPANERHSENTMEAVFVHHSSKQKNFNVIPGISPLSQEQQRPILPEYTKKCTSLPQIEASPYKVSCPVEGRDLLKHKSTSGQEGTLATHEGQSLLVVGTQPEEQSYRGTEMLQSLSQENQSRYSSVTAKPEGSIPKHRPRYGPRAMRFQGFSHDNKTSEKNVNKGSGSTQEDPHRVTSQLPPYSSSVSQESHLSGRKNENGQGTAPICKAHNDPIGKHPIRHSSVKPDCHNDSDVTPTDSEQKTTKTSREFTSKSRDLLLKSVCPPEKIKVPLCSICISKYAEKGDSTSKEDTRKQQVAQDCRHGRCDQRMQSVS